MKLLISRNVAWNVVIITSVMGPRYEYEKYTPLFHSYNTNYNIKNIKKNNNIHVRNNNFNIIIAILLAIIIIITS